MVILHPLWKSSHDAPTRGAAHSRQQLAMETNCSDYGAKGRGKTRQTSAELAGDAMSSTAHRFTQASMSTDFGRAR
jgi:hypothetical protein